MTTESVAWAIGVGMPILSAALLFIANWLHRVSGQVRETSNDLANLRAHVAENYVRGHEVAEVRRAVEVLRKELTHKVDELLKAVHELIGQKTR